MSAHPAPLFILNESPEIDRPGDLTVFATLHDVSIAIEPIDVENREYFLFDTEGQFYEIRTTGEFGRYGFLRSERRPARARNRVESCFQLLGWTWDPSVDLAGNASRLGIKRYAQQG